MPSTSAGNGSRPIPPQRSIEHQRQKAKLVAYQIARYEREHITIEEHNAFVDTIMGLYLSSLGQLPAIMGGQDLAARRKWENFVYETRKKLAKPFSWQKRQSAMSDAEAHEYVDTRHD